MQAVAVYFSTHTEEYVQMIFQHLEVSLLAMGCAILIAVPLGILCTLCRPLEKISVGVCGTLRIVPSLAILLVLIPFMGTGIRPAVTALIVLAIPPVLINTILAFRELPEEVLEAARGMGMDSRRLFLTIKVPLAFPVVFTGIRTAFVEVIASATLAAYIGAGGLGKLIFTGLGLMRTDLLWIGGLSVAALSLMIGQILHLIERRVRRYERVA